MMTREQRLVSETEAAKILGCARITLSRGRSEGPRANRMPVPPYLKIGRSVRYSLDDLERFIENCRITPTAPKEWGQNEA